MQNGIHLLSIVAITLSVQLSQNQIGTISDMKQKSNEIFQSQEFQDGTVLVTPAFSRNEDRRLLTMTIAGMVKAPYDIVRSAVWNFEDYPDFFNFVKAVADDRKRGTVSVQASLLSHPFTSKATYTFHNDVISFTIVEGTLTGCSGFVLVQRANGQQANISIVSSIERKSFPIPDFLIRWGAHHVLGKGAKYFRDKIEKKCLQKGEESIDVHH